MRWEERRRGAEMRGAVEKEKISVSQSWTSVGVGEDWAVMGIVTAWT